MSDFAEVSKSLNFSFQEKMRQFFLQNEVINYIKDSVQDRVYFKGLTAGGLKLRTNRAGVFPYSINTVLRKRKKGQRVNVVTLEDSGDFWRSMIVKVMQDRFTIDADFVKKGTHISDNFTKMFKSEKDFENAVLGLTDDDINFLIQKFYDSLQK